MHMKDLVKLQLSMRKLAQVYHYVEPRLAKKAKDIEVDDSLEQFDSGKKAKSSKHRLTGSQAALLPQFNGS